MVFCNHAFATSFTCACVLGPEVLSTDHRSLLLGLSARVVQGDGVPRQAPEHHLTTFRVGRRLWSNPRIAGCALDMIFPLMCLVPSASASASFGLLYIAAAIYLAFQESACCVARAMPPVQPTYAVVYR